MPDVISHVLTSPEFQVAASNCIQNFVLSGIEYKLDRVAGGVKLCCDNKIKNIKSNKITMADPISLGTIASIGGSSLISLGCCCLRFLKKRRMGSRGVKGIVLPFWKTTIAAKLSNVRSTDGKPAILSDSEGLHRDSLTDESRAIFDEVKRGGAVGFFQKYGSDIITRIKQIISLYDSNQIIVLSSNYHHLKAMGLNEKDITVAQPIGDDPAIVELKKTYSNEYIHTISETKGDRITFTSQDDLIGQIMTKYSLTYIA